MGRIFLQSNDLCLERYLPGRYIQLTKYNLCQFMARCGFTILNYPTIRVEATV